MIIHMIGMSVSFTTTIKASQASINVDVVIQGLLFRAISFLSDGKEE